MAGRKGWGRKDKEPESTPAEVPASAGLEQAPPVQPEAANPPTGFDTPEEDHIPSCMNGCPHFFAVPQDGAKYLGLCRRFPPVPLANARWFSSHTVINHPVRGAPKYPICGEHPVFQQRKDFKASMEIQVE